MSDSPRPSPGMTALFQHRHPTAALQRVNTLCRVAAALSLRATGLLVLAGAVVFAAATPLCAATRHAPSPTHAALLHHPAPAARATHHGQGTPMARATMPDRHQHPPAHPTKLHGTKTEQPMYRRGPTREPEMVARSGRTAAIESQRPARITEASTGQPATTSADRHTEDRVHAWYRTRSITAPVEALSTRASTLPLGSTPARIATSTIAAPTAEVARPSQDLATTPAKATAADFDRAADAQRMTIRALAEQNTHQTTAADDAADAETHIPRTAPTEREPAPFRPAPALPAKAETQAHRRETPAPTMRESPAAGSAPVTDLSAPVPASGGAPVVQSQASDRAGLAVTSPERPPPQSARTGLNAGLSTEGTASTRAMPNAIRATPKGISQHPSTTTDAATLAHSPLAVAADSSRRALSAIAAETANATTPQLKLPAPPNLSSKAAPAIAAIQATAHKHVLDATVSEGMAAETFDGDGNTASASTAVRLATGSPLSSTKPGNVLNQSSLSRDSGDVFTPNTVSMASVSLFDRQGHLLVFPPMKGSHEILVHQNQMAVADGLERIQDDDRLAEMHRLKLLVALPDDDTIYPNDVLPLNRRYARPWTARFLRDMAKAHYSRFGTPLIVTSAARTVEFQRRLVRINGNAAPPTGDVASPHLYGQAVDLAKHGMSLTEITWMRAYLTPVEDAGKIDVEEEFQQSCFHISVYRRYLGVPSAKPEVHKPSAPLLEARAPQTPAVSPKQHRLPTALLATHLP